VINFARQVAEELLKCGEVGSIERSTAKRVELAGGAPETFGITGRQD
jgi:hypothetical protein